jgi:hypothetical protein
MVRERFVLDGLFDFVGGVGFAAGVLLGERSDGAGGACEDRAREGDAFGHGG